MGGGHSAYFWLDTIQRHNPSQLIQYYAFDLGYWGYEPAVAKYIQSKFPNQQFQLIIGDGLRTIPEFIKLNPASKCDLIIMDSHELSYTGMIVMKGLGRLDGKSLIYQDSCITDRYHEYAWQRGIYTGWIEQNWSDDISVGCRLDFTTTECKFKFCLGRVKPNN